MSNFEQPPPKVDDDEFAKTLARLVDAHASHSDAFAVAPGKTIRAGRGQPPAAQRAATSKSAVPPPPPPRAGFAMGPVLGEGGMGVVREARQLALDRDVAIKTIQPKLVSDAVTRMLLQEALILGRLEHPNIPPIYDVRHEAGEPQIVLKKIDGIEWSSVMHKPEVIRREMNASDPLAWNLGILMQVCNAVHFAHSRGFVHRDLKPDNVMIGEFGEVYVMDWGLAVRLEDDGTGRFPLASEATLLAGTPQYMAPEMLGGGTSLISARTDVYLLGAMLYEVVAGHGPHRGKNMSEIIGQVVTSRPALPEGCPAELARICRLAMDPEPAWRFENAQALRLALQGFLQHAGSRRLAEQALAGSRELIALIDKGALAAPSDAERIEDLFVECRFAFRQALELWRDNEQAVTGLHRVVHAMIEYELTQNNPRAAAALLTAVESVDAALRSRVEEAVQVHARSEQRMADLEQLSKQLDIETGGLGRAVGAGILGIVWTVAPVLTPIAWGHLPSSNRWPVVGFLTTVLIAIGAWAYLAHNDIKQSSKTRWLMRGAAVAMVGTLVLELAGSILRLRPEQIEVMWPLVWFCVSAMLTVQVDWRLLPMTLGFLGTLTAAGLWPESRYYAMSASNLVMTVNMFSIWMPWRTLRRS